MPRLEVNQEAIRQTELRGELEAEFGEKIGHALWQYQGGLEMLNGGTPEQRAGLMIYSEKALADGIVEALDSSDKYQRNQGIRALIRVATINGSIKA